MSCWTYINGFMNVGYFRSGTQEERNKKFKELLESLPKVTGSEDDMYVMYSVNKSKSYSVHYDEHGNRKITYDYYLVAFSGSLRDREEEETINEFQNFVASISRHPDTAIDEMIVTINDKARYWIDYDDGVEASTTSTYG